MGKYLLVLLCLIPAIGFADPATYDASWQWNRNVRVGFVYGYQDSGGVVVALDNGEFCYIPDADSANISVVLAMRAQQSVGELVCARNPEMTIEGRPTRRLHRIRY